MTKAKRKTKARDEDIGLELTLRGGCILEAVSFHGRPGKIVHSVAECAATPGSVYAPAFAPRPPK